MAYSRESSQTVAKKFLTHGLVYLHYSLYRKWARKLIGFDPITGHSTEYELSNDLDFNLLSDDLDFNLQNTVIAQIGRAVMVFKWGDEVVRVHKLEQIESHN